MSTTEHHALERATLVASASRCRKSQRGVVVWDPAADTIFVHGWNHRPELGRNGPMCDGSEACRANCGKVCVHAEQDALHIAATIPGTLDLSRCHMLHVKTVDGVAVPSGPPSCWQCSRMILRAGLEAMWLLHEDGLRRYTPKEFHRLTLQTCGLPLPLNTPEDQP